MKKNSLRRLLASLLAVVMLSQVTGIAPGVFAEEPAEQAVQAESPVKPELRKSETPIELLIKKSMSAEAVGEVLGRALIANYDALGDAAGATLKWEFYCSGVYYGWFSIPYYNDAWGSIDGFVSHVDGYPYTHKALKDNSDGQYRLRLAGDTDEISILKVSKYSTELVLRESATVTYDADKAAFTERVVNKLVDFEKSTLPEGVTAADFSVSSLSAGKDQTVTVSYKGSDDYKPCSAKTKIDVLKAFVFVNVKPFITMYAGDTALPKDSVKLNPDDKKIDVFTVFAGIENKAGGKLTSSVYVDLPKSITGILDIPVVGSLADSAFKALFGRYLSDILKNGITVGELREYARIAAEKVDKFESLIERLGVDAGSISKLLNTIAGLPGIADEILIRFGAPAHAGIYQAYVITNSKNYHTGFGLGTVTVKKQTKGLALTKHESLADGELSLDEARAIREGGDALCLLTKDGKALGAEAQSAVRFWFTGMNTAYAGSSMPVKSGRYIVTVTVVGGDYYAPPGTFTFRIAS